MKNKKGFTLIELLVVIALTISILGIVIVSSINVSNRKKEEAWFQIKTQIETAAKEYFVANEYKFEGLSDNVEGYISVGKLVEEDYIGKVTNPITGKAVNSCSLVTVAKKKNKLNATYDDKVSVDDCNGNYIVSIIEPGAPILKTNVECEKSDNSNEWCISDATINVTTNTDARLEENSETFCSGINNNKMTCSSNGTKTFSIEATNNSNKKTREFITVKIDKVKPASPTIKVSGTNGDNGWYKEKDVSISAISTCSNVSGCTLKKGKTDISNDSVEEGTFSNGKSLDKFLYTESDTTGTTRYSKVCSGAGLCSDVSSTTVKVDTKKPAFTPEVGYKVYNVHCGYLYEDYTGVYIGESTSGSSKFAYIGWNNAKIKKKDYQKNNIKRIAIYFPSKAHTTKNVRIWVNGAQRNDLCQANESGSANGFDCDFSSLKPVNSVEIKYDNKNKEYVKALDGSGLNLYADAKMETDKNKTSIVLSKNFNNFIRFINKCTDDESGCEYIKYKKVSDSKYSGNVYNQGIVFSEENEGEYMFVARDKAGNESTPIYLDTTKKFGDKYSC